MIEQFFSSFTFRTIWTPELIVVLLLFSSLYFAITGPLRYHFKDSEKVPTKKKVYFHLGLIAVYFGFGGPLYVLGHLMISMHMFSMAIVYLIAPPLLLLGIPHWFLQTFWKFSIVRLPLKVLGKPLMGLILFNAMFSFYHLPFTFDRLMTNSGLHNIYQLGMLFAAFLMWWHIIPVFPKMAEQLTELKKIGYMFANGVLFTPACVLVIFASGPLYAMYTDVNTWSIAMGYCLPAGSDIPYELFSGENALPPLSPQHDQQFGGAIMKVTQELVYGVAIGYTFKQWWKRERKPVVIPNFEVMNPDIK
ncbi:cytochrome c oxidase assembly factor CtaG [Anaerobacillus arseniciselenatis]|uniref:Cytochrome c oxidase assembly factor CtaG n=1 Tax=Anaerobacillus arseniciselenatis TaxID=85682 RepID=A0A1S2LD43_9BACI|nr:cytochrome c oxidase assembly factor CtaG [Anaerobacillus arseniciselenatis]OIJ10180.1 cytochrome c oxidase assembly factor CtaG [Anaerobacillus arseniciselenatis]